MRLTTHPTLVQSTSVPPNCHRRSYYNEPACQHEYRARQLNPRHKPCSNQKQPRRGHPKHPLGKVENEHGAESQLELGEARAGSPANATAPADAVPRRDQTVRMGVYWILGEEQSRGTRPLSERVGRQLTWLRLSSAALRSSGTWLSAARSTTARLGRSMLTGDGWPAEAEDRNRKCQRTGGGRAERRSPKP
jgi:hypothetical protein